MTDFRSEAIQVFHGTRSPDTRGIIAALLHIADTLAGNATESSSGQTSSPARAEWEEPTVEYLRSLAGRSQKVYEIREWLNRHGFDVEEHALSEGMWRLHREGRVVGVVERDKPRFSVGHNK
ncbi:hypothetical protein [Streptomyces acidicola]|uniref:hypothetical protein n=1 Tax=Streptomyces acidicola TaxID=2596892 RepID=UPI003419F7E7